MEAIGNTSPRGKLKIKGEDTMKFKRKTREIFYLPWSVKHDQGSFKLTKSAIEIIVCQLQDIRFIGENTG